MAWPTPAIPSTSTATSPSARSRRPSWPITPRADPQRIENLFAQEVGYATPKVDVRGVVFRDQALLLVKEREDGRWTLPGGWADVNESPSEAVVREVFEESGYRARAIKLLAVFDRGKHPHVPLLPFHIYKLFLRLPVAGRRADDQHRDRGGRLFPRRSVAGAVSFPHDARPNCPRFRAFPPPRVTHRVRLKASNKMTGLPRSQAAGGRAAPAGTCKSSF